MSHKRGMQSKKKMLNKKLNLKGLRKRVLKLEYANKLIKLSVSPLNSNKDHKDSDSPKVIKGSSLKTNLQSTKKNTAKFEGAALDKELAYSEQSLNYRILILRNVPIEDAVLKQCLTEVSVYEDSINRANVNVVNVKGQTQIVSKCIKKNVLKKILQENNVNDNRWLQCKFMYWMTPDASSLTEQLIQLNHLKACIRAEPKDAFLGCLLESNNLVKASSEKSNTIKYKYYYPTEILNLCDTMDKMAAPNKATGLEVLGQLLYTLESSVNSMSFILALKTKKEQLLSETEQNTENK